MGSCGSNPKEEKKQNLQNKKQNDDKKEGKDITKPQTQQNPQDIKDEKNLNVDKSTNQEQQNVLPDQQNQNQEQNQSDNQPVQIRKDSQKQDDQIRKDSQKQDDQIRKDSQKQDFQLKNEQNNQQTPQQHDQNVQNNEINNNQQNQDQEQTQKVVLENQIVVDVEVKVDQNEYDQSHLLQIQEDKKQKILNDNFLDLSSININFLNLQEELEIQKFLTGDFLQILLQNKLFQIKQIIENWKTDQSKLFRVSLNLYDMMSQKSLKIKDYNNQMLIQNIQSDMYKQLDDYMCKIRVQEIKEFKNKSFGSKLLEVMAESYQLIYQQRKNSKPQLLFRIKEQYEEFLVRKIRKMYLQQQKSEPLYLTFNSNLKILEANFPIKLDWWNSQSNNYKNVFEYLQTRYFNIMGIIKYELILSQEKPKNISFGFNNIVKIQSRFQKTATKLEQKTGDELSVNQIDLSEIMKNSENENNEQLDKNLEDIIIQLK